jgi:hypothetical protein
MYHHTSTNEPIPKIHANDFRASFALGVRYRVLQSSMDRF